MQKDRLLITAKKRVPMMLWSIVRLVLMIGISYTILYPLLARVSLTFMSPDDLGDLTVKWIPRHFTLDNIRIVAKLMDYSKSFFYTAGVCLLVTLLQISVTTLAAYGFARYRTKPRNILFLIVIATLIIPPQTYIVTLYTQFQYFDFLGLIKLFTGDTVNVLNTAWSLIILAAAGMGMRSALYVYIQCQTFRGLPKELEEAARVDGAGTFRTFASVMLPNAIPITIVSALLTFSWQWNDTFYSSLFVSGRPLLSLINVQMKAAYYIGGWENYASSHAQMYESVGNLLKMFPLVILFIFCQKSFIQGAERSGIVG